MELRIKLAKIFLKRHMINILRISVSVIPFVYGKRPFFVLPFIQQIK